MGRVKCLGVNSNKSENFSNFCCNRQLYLNEIDRLEQNRDYVDNVPALMEMYRAGDDEEPILTPALGPPPRGLLPGQLPRRDRGPLLGGQDRASVAN